MDNYRCGRLKTVFLFVNLFGIGFMANPVMAEDVCEDINDVNRAYCSLRTFCASLNDDSAKDDCEGIAAEMLPEIERRLIDRQKSGPADQQSEKIIADGAIEEPVGTVGEENAPPAEPTAEIARDEKSTLMPQPTPQEAATQPTTPSVSAGDVSSDVISATESPADAEQMLQTVEAQLAAEAAVKTAASEHKPGDPIVHIDVARELVRRAYNLLPSKRSFSASLIGRRDFGYEESIVALANGLVFRLQYTDHFKVATGDVLELTRRSRFTTTNYLISGGTGAAVEGRRIRCDFPEPKREVAFWCDYAAQTLIDYSTSE